MTRAFGKQTGLTLVELMVATTLSLVLLAGVLLVFSANKATYQMQNGLGTLQENGRYAVRQIAADLQQAGFGGCKSPHIEPHFKNVVTASGATAWLDDFAAGQFLDGRNDPSGTVTIGSVDMVSNTDSIEIRGPLRSNVAFVAAPVLKNGNVTVLGTATGFANNEFLLIGDCKSGTIFRATNVSTAGSNTVITHTTGNKHNELAEPYGSDAVVMEFDRHTYFVGDTGRLNQTGQAINALYRFDGTNAVELVDGVENMQIDYAFDTDGNGDIDAFGHAGQIRPTGSLYDWDEVMAVRVSLLLNSVEGASAVEAPYTYFPSGSTSISPPTGDFRLRQEFSSLISIRNSVL
ncbi:MAG: PilW family protein [Gammaproteobacteria bacterium]|nr:PilW family protein [Gammaproteobacteria bacterium]